MRIAQNVCVLVLNRVAGVACDVVGLGGGKEVVEAAVHFLTERFTDHSKKLTEALEVANERAWKVLEIALAGESFWERCKVVLARAEDQAFRKQVRAFLDSARLELPGENPDEFRRQCLRELQS